MRAPQHGGGPTRSVARAFPEVRQVVFVDDRALACKQVPVLVRAVEAWCGWSRALGLSENLRKLHLLPRSSAQATDFAALGWHTWVCDAVRVLGVDFTRVRTFAARATCLERWDEAFRIARAIALLHVPVVVRRRFFRVLCAPKASWGGIFRAPAARFVRPMQATYKRISYCHPKGSPPLQQLFEKVTGLTLGSPLLLQPVLRCTGSFLPPTLLGLTDRCMALGWAGSGSLCRLGTGRKLLLSIGLMLHLAICIGPVVTPPRCELVLLTC